MPSRKITAFRSLMFSLARGLRRWWLLGCLSFARFMPKDFRLSRLESSSTEITRQYLVTSKDAMSQLTDEELAITLRVYVENDLPGLMIAMVWIEIYRRKEERKWLN